MMQLTRKHNGQIFSSPFYFSQAHWQFKSWKNSIRMSFGPIRKEVFASLGLTLWPIIGQRNSTVNRCGLSMQHGGLVPSVHSSFVLKQRAAQDNPSGSWCQNAAASVRLSSRSWLRRAKLPLASHSTVSVPEWCAKTQSYATRTTRQTPVSTTLEICPVYCE